MNDRPGRAKADPSVALAANDVSDANDANGVIGDGWRGDEHCLQITAAEEVGLPACDVARTSFARGFTSGVTLNDPWDGALVARGRTPLRCEELRAALAPRIEKLGLPARAWRLAVGDGAFELRVAAQAAEGALPTLKAARAALGLWLGFAAATLLMWHVIPRLWLLTAWSAMAVVAVTRVRAGVRRSRRMLADRLTDELATHAAVSQLILPPAGASGAMDPR